MKKCSRRDLFKVGGVALGALGMAQLPALKAMAAAPAPDVAVYAFKCGILKTQTQLILKDTRKGVPFDVPVPFFIIRHGADWIAYDTGNNAQVAVDPIKYWGKAVCDAYTPVMQPYEEFRPQIRKLGLEPKDLSAVIMSHGHLDHCGALDDLAGTNVPVYFHQNELAQIKKAVESGKNTAYIPADFKKLDACNVKTLDKCLDVFGDQTVVVFPTPGHTPGHQSMFVRNGDGQNLLLSQDACYTLENLTADIPPGLAADIPSAMINIYHFKTMTIMGAQLVPPHDPDFWANKSWGPQKLKI